MTNTNFATGIDDAVIYPKRGKNEDAIPRSGVLFINPDEAAYAHALLAERGGESRSVFHTMVSIDVSGNFFIAGPAVSSPIAALVVEKLIVLGARNLFALSWCGSISPELQIGDTVIGSAPLSGEGTSRYYISEIESYPSRRLSEKLLDFSKKNGINPAIGRIWSTDAPYRESRSFLQRISLEEGIVGVDMEYSALCAVCLFRGIEFASLFIVSDELWRDKWRPGFHSKKFLCMNRLLARAFINQGLYVNDEES